MPSLDTSRYVLLIMSATDGQYRVHSASVYLYGLDMEGDEQERTIYHNIFLDKNTQCQPGSVFRLWHTPEHASPDSATRTPYATRLTRFRLGPFRVNR